MFKKYEHINLNFQFTICEDGMTALFIRPPCAWEGAPLVRLKSKVNIHSALVDICQGGGWLAESDPTDAATLSVSLSTLCFI